MKITLNGREKECADRVSLQNIVEQFCKDGRRIVAEVNGTIVQSQQWAQKILSPGDTIELVSLVGGG